MKKLVVIFVVFFLFSVSCANIFENFVPQNIYFILSGVYDYSISSMSLSSVKNDINNIDVAINNVFNITDEIKLVNLGKDDFKWKLEQFVKRVKPSKNDLFIFYFAGHGSTKNGKGILLLENANGFNPDYGYIYTENIVNEIKKTDAKLMMIIDACYQGKTRGISQLTRINKVDFYVAASTGVAYSKKGGGVLTTIFCNAFNPTYSDANHDMKLTYDEIKNYIIEETKDETNDQQIPCIYSNLKVDMDFTKTYGVLKFINNTSIKNEFIKITSLDYGFSYTIKSTPITLKAGKYSITYIANGRNSRYSNITLRPGKITNINAVILAAKPKHIYIQVEDSFQKLALNNLSITAYSTSTSYKVNFDQYGRYVLYFQYKKDMPIHLILEKNHYQPLNIILNITKSGFAYKGNFIPYDDILHLKMKKKIQLFNMGVFTGPIVKYNNTLIFPSVGSLTDYKLISENDNDYNDGIWLYDLKNNIYTHTVIENSYGLDTDPNSFVLYRGKIFFTIQSGILYSYDLNGKMLWNLKLEHQTFSKPLIKGDYIYVSDVSGEIYKVFAKTGKILNKVNISLFQGDMILSSPVFYNGDFVIVSKFGFVFRFSYDLKVMKKFKITSPGFFVYNPVVKKNKIVFISSDKTTFNKVTLVQIYIYDDYKLDDFSTLDAALFSPPGIYLLKDRLLISIVDSEGVKIYNSSFNLVRSFPVFQNVLASPILFVSNGNIYVAFVSSPSTLYVYSLEGRLILKHVNGKYPIYLKPLFVNSIFYLVDINGKVYSIKFDK